MPNTLDLTIVIVAGFAAFTLGCLLLAYARPVGKPTSAYRAPIARIALRRRAGYWTSPVEADTDN